ncbi:hypothetical protein V7111_10970 [Neobacillus niacini]
MRLAFGQVSGIFMWSSPNEVSIRTDVRHFYVEQSEWGQHSDKAK